MPHSDDVSSRDIDIYTMKLAGHHPLAVNYLAPLIVLALAVIALYGNFLSSPLVFDDYSYFGETISDELRARAGFGLRWLSIATFGWTRAILGEAMIWQRLANLSLHIANSFLLFLFLLRLYKSTLANESPHADVAVGRNTLGLPWLAFFGVLCFALNPAAVYGVAYLAQRTILMATLFALFTWILFLEGLLRNQRRWLLASSVTYLLSVLSKEHAIMVPAVSFLLLLLVRQPSWQSLKQVWPTFLLYGVVGVFTFIQIKAGGVIGRAYEPNASDIFAALNIDPRQAHALSVLNQSFLYFKYLLLWLVPNPGWMSVDMVEGFARSFWSWPQIAALLAFAVYPALALLALLQRGRTGLLGFALLCPWVLFATELSTVRIQENFVLYRSYLWMPYIVAAFPFLFQKVTARLAAILLAAATLALIPPSWNRLRTFSDPLLLWDDALRLAQTRNNISRLGRMYHNRGIAYVNEDRFSEALQDFDAGLKILPYHSLLYTDRAVVYLKTGRYRDALNDYNRAIMFNPNYYQPYLGRAQVHEALDNPAAARMDYARSCRMGVDEVCDLGR